MGVLVMGDPRGAEVRYTIGEICLATGVKDSTLRSRRKRLKIPANADGYTYEQVKLLLKKPSRERATQPQRAEKLKKLLMTNGVI